MGQQGDYGQRQPRRPQQQDPRLRPTATPPQWQAAPSRQDGHYPPPQPQYQPQGYGPQYAPRPPQPTRPPQRRKPNNGLRILAWCSAGLLALIVLIVVFSGKGGSSPGAAASSPSPNPTASAAARAKAAAQAKAISACYARPPASGDIYVRTVIPGLAAQAEELGGHYSWDYVTGQCLNSVDFTIAGAADGPGDCTTVGYVADNPGYDASATPAPPLENIDDEAGSGC